MNPAIKKSLKILEGNEPEEIKKAVNFLCRQNNPQLKEKLYQRIRDFPHYEDYSPLWSIVILGEMRDPDAALYLLDIFDSDEDLLLEAASDALVHIERAYPQSVLPQLFDFIEDRLFNDPFHAKIFAYGTLEAFVQREPVKKFLVRMFEEDRSHQDFISGILVKTGDKKLLELFKKALEFAKEAGEKIVYNEIQWSYFYLDRGKTFSEIWGKDYKESWDKNWLERWDFIFKEMVKSKAEKAKEEKEMRKRLSKPPELPEKEKKELEEFRAYQIAPFSLERYLEIRERSFIEQEFQKALSLLGFTPRWNVERVQILINQTTKPSEVLDRVLGNFMFPSRDSLEIFTEAFNDLWNATPRQEFNGLSPNEKLEVQSLKQEK